MERQQQAKLNGEVTTPEAVEVEVPKKKPKGASAEYMREMTRKRVAMQKAGLLPKPGPPRKHFTKEEKERFALEKLMPKAFKVLQEQLDSRDEKVRQNAAIKVMEYVKGKPTQTIKSEGEQVHTIRYETVAFSGDILTLPESEVKELEPGE